VFSTYKSGGKNWSGIHTINMFKNFDSKDATGFTASSFIGRYISEPNIVLEEGDRSQRL
jgi:hypothetical protein